MLSGITVNLLLSPAGIISNTFEEGGEGEGCLIEMGGLFNLAKALVSALHKELKYTVEKLKYKKLEVTKPRIKKFQTSSW